MKVKEENMIKGLTTLRERNADKESIPCSLCHVRWLDKEPWVEQRRKHFTLGGQGRHHTAENFKVEP